MPNDQTTKSKPDLGRIGTLPAEQKTLVSEAVFVMDYCRTELAKAKETLSAARRHVRRCENELKIAHLRVTDAVMATESNTHGE